MRAQTKTLRSGTCELDLVYGPFSTRFAIAVYLSRSEGIKLRIEGGVYSNQLALKVGA